MPGWSERTGYARSHVSMCPVAYRGVDTMWPGSNQITNYAINPPPATCPEMWLMPLGLQDLLPLNAIAVTPMLCMIVFISVPEYLFLYQREVFIFENALKHMSIDDSIANSCLM